MAFDHRQYNAQYLENIKNTGEPINDALQKYGVRIVEAEVAEGEVYWRAIGVHHLLPRENFSKHNVYLEALDENGERFRNPHAWAGWTWVGRRSNERADPVSLDKPPYESAGNIAMHFGQTITVWIKGLSRDAQEKSDRVENMHTVHPDEPLPDGSLLNTLGHHSFYVVFQRTRKTARAADGLISGRVERGQGKTIQLYRQEQLVADKQIGADLTFKFEQLPYGTYRLQVAGTEVGQANLQLSPTTKSLSVDLALPPPAQSVIFGQVENGAGETLLLSRSGQTVTQLILPTSGQFRLENLSQGVYSLQVLGTTVRRENISLDGTNSREINLVVPDEPTEPSPKTIDHYLLLGPPDTRGRQTNLLLAANFILAFSPTVGFSVSEATQARRVTIIGEGISPAEQQTITDSGSVLEVLDGHPYDIEAELDERVRTGQPFPQT